MCLLKNECKLHDRLLSGTVEAYKKPKFASASENGSTHSYPVVLQHFAQIATQYGIHRLCELLCLLPIFKSTYLVPMLWSLLPVKPSHIAEDHAAGYFWARKRSPGSWGGGGCPSKQLLYFQRSLEKCILCHWQGFVNFPEDTSFFPQYIYLLLYQRDDFALS